jgi:hypothetical protein
MPYPYAAVDWQQYAKWVYNIGRSFYVNPPDAAERTATEAFVNYFWDPEAQAGTRQWLGFRENMTSVSQATEYIGDPNVEPDQVDRKMVKIIGRDIKKIPPTTAEASVIDAFFAATGNRRYNMAH